MKKDLRFTAAAVLSLALGIGANLGSAVIARIGDRAPFAAAVRTVIVP